MLTIMIWSLCLSLLGGVSGRDCNQINNRREQDVIEGPYASEREENCWEFRIVDPELFHGIIFYIESVNLGQPGVEFFFTDSTELVYKNVTSEPSCMIWSFNETCAISPSDLYRRCKGVVRYASRRGPLVLVLRSPLEFADLWKDRTLELSIEYQFLAFRHQLLSECSQENVVSSVVDCEEGIEPTESPVCVTVEASCSESIASVALVALLMILNTAVFLFFQRKFVANCVRRPPAPSFRRNRSNDDELIAMTDEGTEIPPEVVEQSTL